MSWYWRIIDEIWSRSPSNMPTSMNFLASVSVIRRVRLFSWSLQLETSLFVHFQLLLASCNLHGSARRNPFAILGGMPHFRTKQTKKVSSTRPLWPQTGHGKSQPTEALRPRPARRMGSQKGLAVSWSTWLVSHTPGRLSWAKRSNCISQFNVQLNGQRNTDDFYIYQLCRLCMLSNRSSLRDCSCQTAVRKNEVHLLISRLFRSDISYLPIVSEKVP